MPGMGAHQVGQLAGLFSLVIDRIGQRYFCIGYFSVRQRRVHTRV